MAVIQPIAPIEETPRPLIIVGSQNVTV